MGNSKNGEKTIALFIDGDNVSSKFINAVERMLAGIGKVAYKTVYLTYNNGIPKSWEEIIRSHSFDYKESLPTNRAAKNVSDFEMYIKAMDIMNEGLCNTFVIVSNDSDFVPLVKRLKREGIHVIGAGENHAPLAFFLACDEFAYLEELQEMYFGEHDEQTADGETDRTVNDAVPRGFIDKCLVDVFNREGESNLNAGFLNLEIRKKYPEFNYKNYGFKKFTDFLNPKFFKVFGNMSVHYLQF